MHTVALSMRKFAFMLKDKSEARDSSKDLCVLVWALNWYQCAVFLQTCFILRNA